MKIMKYLLLLCIIGISWAAQATKITSDTQLLTGDHAVGVIGDYILSNDSVSFIISDIPNVLYPGNTGGLCIDAALNGGIDDFDLMYLYLNKDWPRQGDYNSISIISAGAPYDSAHIRVKGVDSDNADITITTDYILYDNTPIMKVVTRFNNQSTSTLSSYGMGDAFSWGSGPFVPGGNSSTGWLASQTTNTLYGYTAHENFEAIHGGYWSDATLEETDILPGDSASVSRYFIVAEDLAGIYNTFLDIRDLPTGQVTVSVTQESIAVNNAHINYIKEMESGSTLEGYTNNLGLLNSRLETGNWICKVITGGQTKEQSISIATDEAHELNFSMDIVAPPIYKQDTLTIIQAPLINIPTMALPGDTFKVEIELPISEFVQSLSLLFNGNEYELAFIESTVISPFGLRTLEVYLPSTMFYGLYDLKITCTGSDSLDISEQALYVIPEYKDSFSFIHVTDTHLPSRLYWGDDGVDTDTTEIQDFREVINDINIINPDFVLHTGDFINDGEIEELGIPSFSRGKKLLHELDVPLFLVAGNHDLGGWISTPAPDGTARRTWWKYFGWKYLSSISTTATTTQNYSFDYGNAHFIGLEAYDNYDKWRYDVYGDDSFISSQLGWLSNDLAEHADADLKVLFYHYDFKHELDLSALGVDATFWGHVHSNNEDATLPYDISTAATCSGARWYRIVKIVNNEITFNRAIQAGYSGETLIKTVNTDHSLVRISNNSNVDFENCLVKFHLEEGKKITSLTNATLWQVDSLSSPKIVYANVDVPANTSVDASIQVEDIETSIEKILPDDPFLLSIYPNPFNPKLAVSYQLSIVSLININVYNTNGKMIETLFNGDQNSGTYELSWDASNQPSGLYFIKAEMSNASGNFQTVSKCLLMK
ncbi:MAG: metallophosphoesterase [Candidatus Marinimicrobia bacterium]|nr:metallophosphoesterase [Candidatus Neomarinimicrobiota bacterium]